MHTGAGVVQAGEARSARIESLRAVAALAVIVFHVHITSQARGEGDVLRHLSFGGAYGVFLFFALSGYLLFLPFVRAARPGGRRVDLARYARNRALRILPLYYFVLVVLLLVREGGGSWDQWWRFATFTESFFPDTVNTVDGPMWSLALELQFYALLPVFGWVIARRRTAWFATGVVAALGAASVVIWLLTTYRHGADTSLRWRYSLPPTFFEFTPGMLLAIATVELERRRPLRLPPSDVLLVAAVAIWVVAAYSVRGGPLIVAAASLLVLAAVVLPARDGLLVRVLDLRVLSLVGIVSYGVYLWQLPLIEELQERLDWSFPALLPLGAVASVAAGAATYVLVERHFLALRRRWGATAAAPPAPEGPPANRRIPQGGRVSSPDRPS